MSENFDRIARDIPRLLDEGDYTKALKACEEAIGLDPEVADVWINKGVTLAKLGKHMEAIEAYEKAISLNPDDADAWFNRGLCTRHMNRHDVLQLGAESYSKAVAADPKCFDAWQNLGNVTFRIAFENRDMGESPDSEVQGWFQKSEYAYDKALELDPQNAHLVCNKGVMFTKNKKFPEALEQTERSVELDPEYTDGWYCLGYILGELGRFQESIEAYSKAIELNPSGGISVWAWINTGNILGKMGRFQEAAEAYDRAIALDPKNFGWYFQPSWSEALYNKSIALKKLGKHKEAQQAHEKAIGLNPDLASMGETLEPIMKETGPAAIEDEHIKR